MDLCKLTLRQASDGLKGGAFSSVELTRALLARMEESQSSVHAYVSIDAESALKQAEAADAARACGKTGDLLGVPVAVKDNMNVIGQPCTCSSKILQGYKAPYDATVVARLRAAGAVFAGRTNMDEFALGSTTETSAFGVTHNPHFPGYIPGGSSGGSAAAVGGNLAIAALGSDTGGSIRQPSSHCGCVGVKPTYGRVSRFGVAACASSLDQVGPMTKTVEDAAMLLNAIAGHDPFDATALAVPVPDYAAACRDLGDKPLKGMKLGLPKEYFVAGVEPEVLARVQAAIRQCEALGGELVELSMPHTEYAIATYYICMTAEVSANLARFDGVRYGMRVPGSSIADQYDRTREAGFGAETKRRAILGTFVLSSGFSDAYYKRALKVRTLIRRDFENAFKQCDALVTPVTPEPAWKLGERCNDPLRSYLADIFTVSSNLAGVCGMAVPSGATAAGFPVGVQFLGPAFGEETLFKLGHAYETARNA